MPIHTNHHHTNNHHAPPPPPPPPPKTNTNPRKLLFFVLKCFIMACILSLFLLFLGFAAIVLLHFLFITTAFRHRRCHRPSTSTTMQEFQDCLPYVIYTGSGQSINDCPICLDCFKEGESCRILPACGHLFHMICVDSWLTKVPNCPICRTMVQLGSRVSSPVMSDDDWKIWWTVGG